MLMEPLGILNSTILTLTFYQIKPLVINKAEQFTHQDEHIWAVLNSCNVFQQPNKC